MGYGTDTKDMVWEDLQDKIESLEYDKDRNLIIVSWCNQLGSFNLHVPLDDDAFLDVLEAAIKRANKYKTLLEASKG